MFGLNFENIFKKNVPPIERGLNEPGAEEKLAEMKAEREAKERQEGDERRAELQKRADEGEIIVKH